MKDLSIIIVSYNTNELLETCLTSVLEDVKHADLSVEIIVVDNGSKDDSVSAVIKFKAQISKLKTDIEIHLIENKVNLGFAKANNQGAKIATGRYILFLNSDTIVHPNVLLAMIEFMDQRPYVGIASCQLRNPDGSIQPQGGSLPRLSTVAIWSFFLDDFPILHKVLSSYQLRRNFFFTGIPKQIGWVGGTAMWVRREAWEKFGGFDEQLFMYGEDVDLCYRAHVAKFDVMINPEISITHKGQGSGGGTRWVSGEVKGLLYLFRKHKPSWELPILKLILTVGMALRWLIFGILGKNEAFKRAYREAVDMARS